jgi:hypothetical protein
MERLWRAVALVSLGFVFAVATAAVAGAFWSVHLDLTHPAFTLPPCR